MKNKFLLLVALLGIGVVAEAGNLTVQYTEPSTLSAEPPVPVGKAVGLPCATYAAANGGLPNTLKQAAVTVSIFIDGGQTDDCIKQFGARAYMFVPTTFQVDGGGGWVRDPELDLPEREIKDGLLCQKGLRQLILPHTYQTTFINNIDGGSNALTEVFAPNGSINQLYCPQGGRLFFTPYNLITTDAGTPPSTWTLDGVY